MMPRDASPPEPASSPTLYVGVDGGGSTCRVRIRDETGRWRSGAVAGASNVYLDFQTAVATIAAAVRQALDAAAFEPARQRLRIGMGLAGVSAAAAAAEVARAWPLGGEAVLVVHDAEIACIGAHRGEDGGLIIAGTGSAAVARIGGRSIAVGGRGFILGDDGSGARLGLAGLRLALRAHDDLSPHTALTRELMGRFGNDPVAAIAWGRTARSSDFGTLAPMIVAAAHTGDPAGLALVRDTVAALGDHAAALRRLGADRLSLVGGLAAPLMAFLTEAWAGTLVAPALDALDGALLLAGCPAAAIAQAGPGPR